jgi:predicted CXXCH cytochrome family protein
VQDSLILSDASGDTSLAVTLTSGDSLRDGNYYHYPFSENYCTSCHDENSKSKMIMPEPGLCYTCHEDYSSVYTVVHGPAAGGYCTSCHHPHMSEEAKLLKRKGIALCLYCHESRMIAGNPAHDEAASMNCTGCHNPHGGNDRNLIR